MIGAIAGALPGSPEPTVAEVLIDPHTPVDAQPEGTPGGTWVLDMSEEFNHPVQVIDANRGYVAFHPGGGVWDTGYPPDTFTGGRFGANSHNLVAAYNLGGVSTRDGALRLTVTARPKPKSLNPDWPLTHQAGMVTTYPFRIEPYGYFEARMKLPGDAASWPAFWLWFDTWGSFEDPPLPPDEIDIMECFFSATEVEHHTHFSGADADGSYPAAVRNWNTYGCKWTPTELKFYVNGIEVGAQGNTAAIPTAPMFIILNHAFKNPPDGSPTPQFSRTEVDYVRVWASA